MNIPIVIAFTPNYLVPAATTLQSILNSLSSDAILDVICLMTEDPSEKMVDELKELVRIRADVRFINMKGRLGEVYVDPRYSEAASYRLMMPELLPDYDKVIYIDCDVIVRNDLADLFTKTDLGNAYLAAVYEAPLDHQVDRFKAIGCDPLKYFNSGFLIMNLAKMREDGVSQKLIEAIKVDYLEFPDQDALNQVCQGHVLGLSPIYNSIRTFFLPQYKDFFLRSYSDDEWALVQDHGTIHYTGGKPWNVYTVQFDAWWKVYESLPDMIKQEWSVNHKLERLYFFYRTSIGHLLIDAAQKAYRKIKHS